MKITIKYVPTYQEFLLIKGLSGKYFQHDLRWTNQEGRVQVRT